MEAPDQYLDEYRSKYVGDPKKNPLHSAGFFSMALFNWMTPLIEVGNQTEFTQSLHYELLDSQKTRHMAPLFEKNWLAASAEFPPLTATSVSTKAFFRAVWLTFKPQLAIAVASQVFSTAAELLSAWLVYISIDAMAQVDYSLGLYGNWGPLSTVCLYLALLLTLRMSVALLESFAQYNVSSTGYQLRNSIDSLLLKKLLKKGMERDTTFDLAEITSFTQVDSNKLCELCRMLIFALAIPLKITFGVLGLFVLMGWAMIPTMVVFGLIVVGYYYIARYHEFCTSNYMQSFEARTKYFSEIFSNIKFIKMSGYEGNYLQRLGVRREKEIVWIKKRFLRWMMSNFMLTFGCSFFVLVLYTSKLYVANKLTLQEAVVANLLFSMFAQCLRSLGLVAVFVKECTVSSKRLSFFLLSEEIDLSDSHKWNEYRTEQMPSSASVTIKSGNFYWEDIAKRAQNKKMKLLANGQEQKDPQPTELKVIEKGALTEPLLSSEVEKNPVLTEDDCELILKELDFEIQTGSCVAVVGKIGSGKSSLFSAIIGEMYAVRGSEVTVAGSMAYVSQKPWITSSTIKDVILFGKEYNHERFEACLEYSGLKSDLKCFSSGIDTLLGDRGVNLSGGQKTRVAIARAFYSDADIFLLDDPISALDVHVGKLVMEEGILKYLKGKTRIVATHALSYLPYFDYIFFMEGGKIAAKGTYQQLLKNPAFQLFTETETNSAEKKDATKEVPQEKTTKSTQSKATSAGEIQQQDSVQERLPESLTRIIKDEEKAVGAVFTKTLVSQFAKFGGGWWIFVLAQIALLVRAVFDLVNMWYVQYWTIEKGGEQDPGQFLLYMTIITFAGSTALIINNWIIARSNVRRSLEVSFMMAFRLLHSSMNTFIDRVPTGRVLNRFIKDMMAVDNDLLYHFGFFGWVLFQGLTDLMAAVYGSSIFIIFFFVGYAYLILPMRNASLKVNREITRLRSISGSPLVQSISEATLGASTIRVFGRSDDLLHKFQLAQDVLLQNMIIGDCVSMWLTTRMVVYSLLILVPALAFNLFYLQSGPGIFGFLLRFLMMVLQDFNEIVGAIGNLELRMVSFERCLHFTDITPEVGYQDLEKTEASLREGILPPVKKTIKPNGQVWPSTGDVSIKGLKVKYRPGLPEVLKGLTLNIRHGTKVGIVGRTGAGKSTLLSCLYRHFEEYSGEVVIDGRELRDIDLKELRSNITIIPQDPYIFQDTVRANLDPLGHRTDTELENILKEINLWEKFKSKGALEALIEKGGSDLSQGEKQLLCLARALLHRNKLVLIDEATANIDANSEVIIQRLLEEKFKDCTMLMIAHRLNTVMKCDYILVLEQGNILEYGSLEDLKKDTKSHFYNMMNTLSDLQQALS